MHAFSCRNSWIFIIRQKRPEKTLLLTWKNYGKLWVFLGKPETAINATEKKQQDNDAARNHIQFIMQGVDSSRSFQQIIKFA